MCKHMLKWQLERQENEADLRPTLILNSGLTMQSVNEKAIKFSE